MSLWEISCYGISGYFMRSNQSLPGKGVLASGVVMSAQRLLIIRKRKLR